MATLIGDDVRSRRNTLKLRRKSRPPFARRETVSYVAGVDPNAATCCGVDDGDEDGGFANYGLAAFFRQRLNGVLSYSKACFVSQEAAD